MSDDIVTTAQAARMLGVSVRTAQLWIEQGSLPHWKTPGGHRRVRRVDVEMLIGSRSVDAVDDVGADVTYPFPVAKNERDRLAAVRRTGLLNTPPDEMFDQLTWLASRILKTPISLVTMLTPTMQWFKSRVGLEVPETPREWAFCNYTVMQKDIFMVSDLLSDERFTDNAAVHGEPGFRFYAGSPLFDAEGYAVGSLCVIDRRVRRLTDEQTDILRRLSILGSNEIRQRAH